MNFEESQNNINEAIRYALEYKNLESKNDSIFIHKKLAWLHLGNGDWLDSCFFAFQGCRLPNTSDEDKVEFAKIISLNKKEYFEKAAFIYKSLKHSENEKVRNECEKYFKFLEEVKKIDGDIDEEIHKDLIFKNFRPRLKEVHIYYKTSSKLIYELLKREKDLSNDSIDFGEQYDELLEIKKAFDDVQDVDLKALFYRKLARTLFKKYQSLSDRIEEEEIDSFFKKSIELNNRDCFTYNFYATFLKDVKHNYEEATKMYDKAIEVGNNSDIEFFNNLHTFIRNKAFLIMEQIRVGIKAPEEISTVISLLQEAIIGEDRGKIEKYKYAKIAYQKLKEFYMDLNKYNEWAVKNKTY